MFKYTWINITLNLISKLTLFWLGIYNTIFALAEIYQIPILYVDIALYSFIILLAFVILFQSYKTALISSPFFICLFIKIYFQHNNFISKATIGFCIVINKFLDRINHLGYNIDFRYNINDLFPKFNLLKVEDYTTPFLIVIIIFLSLIIVIFAYKKSKPTIVVYTIIILMLPGILFRFMPSIELFRIIFSFIISLLSINIFYKFIDLNVSINSTKKSIFKTSFAGKSILIIFALSYLISTVLSYVPEDKAQANILSISKVTNKLNRLEQKISSLLSFDIGFNGGISKGELGQGGFRYSDIPMLEVHTDSNMTMYLKTWVGKNYFNNRWFSFDNEEIDKYLEYFGQDFMPEQITWDFFRTLSDASKTASIVNNNVFITDVKINYINANKSLVYTPTISNGIEKYFKEQTFENKGEGVAIPSKAFNVQDGYSAKAVTFLYSNYFKFLVDNAQKLYKTSGGKNSELEDKYRNFVYSNYIYLPTELFESIKDLAVGITNDYENKYDKVLAIQNYLAQNYTYNLNPPTNGDDKDFVEYFLFESKEGYCTYYATSMVLMLRAIGIPARYVEGYLVPKDENIQSDVNVEEYRRIVLDKNAHAWPEVYFDSIGWLPFEPTVTYTDSLMNQDSETANNNFYEENTVTPSEANIEESTDIEQPEVKEEEKVETKAPIMHISLFIIIILMISYIVVAFRNIKHFNYKRIESEQIINLIIELIEHLEIKQNSADLPSEFASKVDSQLLTTISYNDILDITLKSRFSKDNITKEETQKLKDYLQQLIKALYIHSNIIKKIYYRWFLFIKE